MLGRLIGVALFFLGLMIVFTAFSGKDVAISIIGTIMFLAGLGKIKNG